MVIKVNGIMKKIEKRSIYLINIELLIIRLFKIIFDIIKINHLKFYQIIYKYKFIIFWKQIIKNRLFDGKIYKFDDEKNKTNFNLIELIKQFKKRQLTVQE